VSVNEFQEKSPSLPIYLNKGEKILYSFPRGLHNLKVIKEDSIIVQNLKEFVVKKKGGIIVYRFKLGSIYGYCKNGVCHRYYSELKNWRMYDEYYKIEDEGFLIIYSIIKWNGRFSSTHYYYSFALDTPLKSLTMKNIEGDLRDKQELIQKIKNTPALMKNIAVKSKNGNFLLNLVIQQ
jgi:hypothetical protein